MKLCTKGQLGARLGITLIEVLIVVAMLGIAGAMVIPSMANVGVLRIQAAVRTVVGDITFIQSEALANQSRYVMAFGVIAEWNADESRWELAAGNGYTVFAPPPGATLLDTTSPVDMLFDPMDGGNRPLSRDFDATEFAGARIDTINFNGGTQLIYDELGGPVLALTGDDPGAGGSFRILGNDSAFIVSIEPFTGRVEVVRVNP